MTIDVLVCCFKQKTAYEMRISYWSSDVCSSDRSGNFRGLSRPIDGVGGEEENHYLPHRHRHGERLYFANRCGLCANTYKERSEQHIGHRKINDAQPRK